MPEQKPKPCTLLFKDEVNKEDQDRILTYLGTLDQLENVKLDGRRLTLTYPFPLLTSNVLISLLGHHFPGHVIHQSPINRLMAYIEQNERDYIVFQPGWSRYVEDIYIHYFDQRHGGKRDVRNMLWRKYNKYKKKRVEV